MYQRYLSTRGWWDLANVFRSVIPVGTQLLFKIPERAALRALVLTINSFTCQGCDAQVQNPPVGYDGRETLFLPNGQPLVLDHVLSRANGGTNHPDNLQPLCGGCNTRKASSLDKRINRALRSGELCW
jgi:5-methylcytosine-specific restriction endonuclease McrA